MSIFYDYDQKAKYQCVKLPTLKYIFNVAVMENSMALFQKIKQLLYGPTILLLSIYLKESKAGSQRGILHISVHRSIIHNT